MGSKLIKGVNDLATLNPNLAKEWHPTKNGDLTPQDVTCGSSQKVWWLLPYDTEDGRHFDFEWQAIISNRNKGIICPFLSKTNYQVWKGFNDLATVNPQLASEWHPTKNGNLKPTDIRSNSTQIVWWYLPYDDPNTGKHFDFEWQAIIANRNRGANCPYLTNHQVWPGFNDLETINPQLASEWHPTKNGNLKPQNFTYGSEQKVWWLYSYDDPITGKHFDFEWQASICERNRYNGCPYLYGKLVYKGFNDLETINPNLAKEWHPTKNGELKPSNVCANSNKKVWWYLPYDDQTTSKHFDFEWQATIDSRNKGDGCPFLSKFGANIQVYKGFNDLETINPELAKEWHPTKNGELKPSNVCANSNKKVWWYLPYDDPKTGKYYNFEWQAIINSRNNGIGCPFLSGHQIYKGFNDLETINPQLASEWHPTKNGNLTPFDVVCNSHKKVWWYLPYDDPKTNQHFDFEWQATIASRNKSGTCPFITSSRTEKLLYDLIKIQNIKFFAEQKFSDCKYKSYLPFDLYLPNENIILECDGIQHFEPIKFFGGKKHLQITIKRDNIKNQYCKDNNISLLRIPYTYDPIVDKDKIENIVLEFIKTKKVPQEIIDFYSKYKFSNYVECVSGLNKD